MKKIIRRNSGFGMAELLVGLVVMAIIMAVAFQFTLKTTRVTTFHGRTTKLSGDVAALQFRLTKMFREMGYNSNLVEYPLCCGTVAESTRFGPTNLKFSEIEFTSDINPSGVAGVVDAEEKYALWVAKKETPGTHVNFDSITQDGGEPCTSTSGTFTETYTLFKKIGSEESILADKVLCFEVRYYRTGSSDAWEKDWVQLCPADANCPTPHWPADDTDVSHVPKATSSNFQVAEFLPVGPGDPSFDETAYYTKIRNDVQKIQVGIVVQGAVNPNKDKDGTDPNDRYEIHRIVFDAHLANLPWLASISSVQLQ
jgi:hypothetical protein